LKALSTRSNEIRTEQPFTLRGAARQRHAHGGPRSGQADQGPPLRTISDTSAGNLMLMGYEPAAYFKINEAVTGDRRPATGDRPPSHSKRFHGQPQVVPAAPEWN